MRTLRMAAPLFCAIPLFPACSSLPLATLTPSVKPSAAVSHSRDRPETHLQLARELHARGRLNQAADAYGKALAGDGGLIEAMNGLAVLHAMQGRYDAALAQLRAALSISPRAAHLHNNLGYVHSLAREYREAVQAFETARKLEPGNVRALSNLASAHDHLGEHERARELRAEAALPGTVRAPAAAAPAGAPRAGVEHEARSGNRNEPRAADFAVRQVNPHIYELVATAVVVSPVREPAALLARELGTQASGATTAHSAPVAPAPETPSYRAIRVEVSNGNGIAGMARRVGSHLARGGVSVVRFTDHVPFRQAATEVQYQAAYATEAARFAAMLQMPVKLVPSAALRSDIHVRLLLGRDVRHEALLLAPPAPVERHLLAGEVTPASMARGR
jgi:hypothetical protein